MNEEAVAAVVEAWMNPGPVPEYHYWVKEDVARRWPSLAIALDALSAKAPRG